MRERRRTEDHLLSGCKHVQRESDLVLVLLELQPADEGGEEGGGLAFSPGSVCHGALLTAFVLLFLLYSVRRNFC